MLLSLISGLLLSSPSTGPAVDKEVAVDGIETVVIMRYADGTTVRTQVDDGSDCVLVGGENGDSWSWGASGDDC